MAVLSRFPVILATVGALLLAACGSEQDATVRWELSIANVAGQPFGVRMLLDGKEVFAQPMLLAASYTTTLEGQYALDTHVVEWNITAGSPGRYVAGVKYTILPEGRAAIVDGVPTDLRVGERLRVVIPLAAESHF